MRPSGPETPEGPGGPGGSQDTGRTCLLWPLGLRLGAARLPLQGKHVSFRTGRTGFRARQLLTHAVVHMPPGMGLDKRSAWGPGIRAS